MDIEQTIKDNERLAYYQIKKFGMLKDPDAHSVALEALWVAAKTYDESKNTKFSTYASVCIYNALGMYLRKLKARSSVVLLPYENPDSANDELDKLYHENMQDNSMSPMECYERKELREKLHAALEKVIAECRLDLHKQVLRRWVDSNGTVRQVDVAKELGTTQANVSRIISAAMYKLRKELEDYLC